MSEAAPYAARMTDPVAHSHALAGFLAGAVVGLVAATEAAALVGAVVGAVALEVGTAGLATPLLVGVAATAVEFGVGAYVGSQLMGAAENTGEALGAASMGSASGKVSQGSPDVHINGLSAARLTDAETCHDGKIAQGSSTVRINGLLAARVGDRISCGGQVLSGSPNVRIGGPVHSGLPIQSEVPEWVRWATLVVSILPALGQAGRAIGPALAEVEATGFGRAMQTGVKALGRAMEERAGGVRAPIEPPVEGEPAATPQMPRALSEPSPSQAPYDREPAIPAGGRSNPDFTAKRAGGLDMENLSPADSDAADAMKRGGWNGKMQEQVLDSGGDFQVRPGQAGEPMYKFSSADRDEAGAPDSAYYTDQAGFDQLKSQHYDEASDTWDGKGVKNSLALPCYNSADTPWRGQLGSDQSLVASKINPAVETVTLTNADGSTASVFQRAMQGGGGQVTPAKGGVVGLSRFNLTGGP